MTRSWLCVWFCMIGMIAATGCGGPKQPDEMIYISVVTTGDPAQRDVRIVPDLDGATVEVWELKEPKDLTAKPKKNESPMPPTKTSRLAKADYIALWKSFPKGHVWTLKDMKNEGTSGTTPPIYTLELIHPGHHLKVTIENPEQQSDKSAWQIIQPVFKAAGIQ